MYLYYVYQRSKNVKDVDEAIVATDDERIREVVESFNGKVKMTSPHHKSGTDEIAEAAKNLDADIIVNVQGDEPLIEQKAIEQAITPLREDEKVVMSTLMTRITDDEDYANPNVVKVVVDKGSSTTLKGCLRLEINRQRTIIL